MEQGRFARAKLNIVISLLCQVITLLCGLIVPRMMLSAFGSEVYGATSSITQFLAYITLLEGGVGGVARAVLYKPLAENDLITISAIMGEIKRFFRLIGFLFAGYVLIIACGFRSISGMEQLDWITTFILVIVISLSTFGQYFIGISNSVLLQAAQRSYITNLVNIVGTVVNAVSVCVLVSLKCDIITVKLVSSVVYVMRPVALWLYVRRKYDIVTVQKSSTVYLKDKWSGMAQHIAYFLHSNTDVVVLTCLADLKAVAVYSVYHMVTSNIQNLTTSFVSGMESMFGDMLAKQEHETLHKTFRSYEMIISVVSVILFSTTAVMILPFVGLYTRGITDTNYREPALAMFLILSCLLYCLRMPYHSMVIAAGHFRQTRAASCLEAAINIGLSVLLVNAYGLPGVALATMLATGFRFAYYVFYLSKHIFFHRVQDFLYRLTVNIVSFGLSVAAGMGLRFLFTINSYLMWAVCGGLCALLTALITVIVNGLFFRSDFSGAMRKMMHRS